MAKPPYDTGKDVLFVAYFASAEMSCHLSLGWPLPENLLDLYTEFRVLTNGHTLTCGKGLLGALAYFGIDGIDVAEKDKMRQLVMRGGPWSTKEQHDILEYCESDVTALDKLYPRLEPHLDGQRSLLRGRYMKAVAVMEANGVPIDVDSLNTLRIYWDKIKDKLIERIDADYRVYENGSFKAAKFADFLVREGLSWPMSEDGKLILDEDTFRDMAKVHPIISPLHELRASLSKMRLSELAVGADGRNRCMLSPFQSRTGRNQPSNARFCFGPAVWIRSLIQPRPGYGLAYIDWCQQEFGIAAALSKDSKMIEAYISGDPYLAFAKQAGEAPPDATKESHESVRDKFKECILGVQYGMAETSLGARIGQPPVFARELLQLHRRTYPGFWRWSDAVVDYANLMNSIYTVFGWRLAIQDRPNPRSLRNFPMQANGSEMLRLASTFCVEAGIEVCAPVHDALLIQAPLDRLKGDILTTQSLMAQASSIVLGGFTLRSDVKIIASPNRYTDKRGAKMWKIVWELIAEIQNTQSALGEKSGHP